MMIQKMSALQLSCSVLYVLVLQFPAQTFTQEVVGKGNQHMNEPQRTLSGVMLDLNAKGRTDDSLQLLRDVPRREQRSKHTFLDWVLRPRPVCKGVNESCVRINPTPSQKCCNTSSRKCVYDVVLRVYQCRLYGWIWGN